MAPTSQPLIINNVSIRLIIAYTYAIIFGGWVMALAHIPNVIALTILRILDVLPLICFMLLFRLQRTNTFTPNSITYWGGVAALIIVAMLSAIVHQTSISTTLTHITIMFRYMPLAYFIYKIKNTNKTNNIFITHFRLISIILLAIGIIEVIIGEPAITFFTPVIPEKEADIPEPLNFTPIKSIAGIFPNTIDYAYIIMLSYIFFININHHTYKYLPRPLLDIIYLFVIFASGSKAALIISLIALYINISHYKFIKPIVITIFLLIITYLLYTLWDLFYWIVFEDSLHSRLGMMVYTLPSFLKDCSFSTFFGLTPNRDYVYYVINTYQNVPSMLSSIDAMHAFEDGFYVALIIYYGVIGFSILVSIYYNIYKTLKPLTLSQHSNINYNNILRSIFICLIIAPLFNQIIITRPFAIFMWIIFGLMYKLPKDHETSTDI